MNQNLVWDAYQERGPKRLPTDAYGANQAIKLTINPVAKLSR